MRLSVTTAATFASTSPAAASSACRCRTRSCANSSAAADWARGCCSTKAPRIVDPLAPEAPLIFAFSPLVGSPLTTSAKFAVVSKSPLTGSHQRFAGQQRLRDRRQALRLRRHRHRRTRAGALGADHRRRRRPPRSRPRIFAARRAGTTEAALKARLGADYQVASIGPAGEHAGSLRHDLARWPPRRPRRQRRRAGQQEHQGDRRARNAALPSGRIPRELTASQQDSVETVVRSRNGEVPRARHRDQSADVQSLRRAADAQLSERHVRGGRQPLARADCAPRTAKTRASCVACTIGCEHIYSLGDEQRRARSSTRACSRWARCAAWRRRRRAPRVPASATSWASTRSAPAARSRLRWSASSAAGSTSRGSRSEAATRCCARSS